MWVSATADTGGETISLTLPLAALPALPTLPTLPLSSYAGMNREIRAQRGDQSELGESGMNAAVVVVVEDMQMKADINNLTT